MAETPKTDHAKKGLGSQEHVGTGSPESEAAIAKKGEETVHIDEEGEPLGANFA